MRNSLVHETLKVSGPSVNRSAIEPYPDFAPTIKWRWMICLSRCLAC